MKRNLWTLLACGVAVLLTLTACAANPSSTPTEVAGAYLTAMEGSDLAAAETLFAAGSSIFESGGIEGTWHEYRDHHIGPELHTIESFSIDRGEPTGASSSDGSMAFVAWPIEYTIRLADRRVIESRGTVTFVLERDGSEYKIRHLHWSSRKRRPADGDGATAALAAFHEALAGGDESKVLELLDPAVLIFESGGAELSRDEYASHHLGADMAFSAATSQTVVERKESKEGDVAWVVTRSETKGTFRDQEVDLLGTETALLRRGEDGWRIVHLHWSSRPRSGSH